MLWTSLYRGYDNNDKFEEQAIALPATTPPKGKIIDVRDDQLVSTRQGGLQKFLFRWQNRLFFDAPWITTIKFQCLHPNLYEYYQAINMPESSSSKLGRVVSLRTRPKKLIGPTH